MMSNPRSRFGDDDPIVVTGMGAVSALGSGCAAHLEALRTGRDGLRAVRRFETGPFGGAIAGTWPAWDDRVQPQASLVTSLQQSAEPFSTVDMAEVAAREALAMARIDAHPPTGGVRVALILGTCFGQGFSLFSEVAEALAKRLGVVGPAWTISTACSSSTNAIGLGRDLIRQGSVDVVLAGGVDVFLREVLAGFSALGVVNAQKCSPFGLPVGINLAEGAGIVVLERAKSAEQRGVAMLASIDGYGLAADAHHETTPDPTGRGLARTIEGALVNAGVEATEIDYVNAHATGTESNDRTEWLAVQMALGARPVPISGLKSFLGHAQGAAGVLELILGVLAMGEGFLPPTLRLTTPRPGAPADPVAGPYPRPGRVRRALDISAAFGGANAVLVYGDPQARLPARVPAVQSMVVVRGLGLVSPLGLGVHVLSDAIASGRTVAGACAELDLTSLVPTADPRGSDRSTLLLTTAVALALRDAGGDGNVVMRGSRRQETGLFVGATRMPAESARRCHESLLQHGPAGMSAAAFARMSVNAPTGACAKHLCLQGPTTTISIGAGSGLAAFAYAAEWLSARPDAKRLLVGAIDEEAEFQGASCVLLERTSDGRAEDDIAVAGCGIAGPDDLRKAVIAAIGDHPCPDGVWGEGASGQFALAPRVADARQLPLGFLDLATRIPPGEACLSAIAMILAIQALREKRARSMLVVAARGRASSVAVLLRRHESR
jgi:3-oxoacyl-[acyl-carrier-protein] synthase II